MKKYLIGLMTSCSVFAATPALAQATSPAPTTAPGGSDEDCEDNSYVPVYEIPDNGATDSSPKTDTATTPGTTTTATPATPATKPGTTTSSTTNPAKGTPAKTTPAKPGAKPPVNTTPSKPVTGSGIYTNVPGANRNVNGQPVVVGPGGKQPVNVNGLRPEMKAILPDIYRVADQTGFPKVPVITSARDGVHGTTGTSKHYVGGGIDLRCKKDYATDSQCLKFAADLRKKLGPGYAVKYEQFKNSNDGTNHIHIQYPPKGRKG